MNILIPDSWLREYLKTKATPKQIKEHLSLCGPSVERIHEIEGELVYDVEVTSNRPDSMSVVGVAREAAAILPRFGLSAKLVGDPYKDMVRPFQAKTATKTLTIKTDPLLCPRWTSIVLENVAIKPSPGWLKKKLELTGIRSINNVIDITNFLMRSFGQPAHAFDFDRISDKPNHATMILRPSRKGEELITLDGKSHTLPGGDIVIEDGAGRLIDLCGIMGGENSAITQNTKTVILFLQTYDPVRVRRTMMALAHRTEAGSLFEKGTDPQLVLPTIRKGIELIGKLTGGHVASTLYDLYSKPYKAYRVSVNRQKVDAYMGTRLSDKEIQTILSSLGFTPIVTKEAVTVAVPSFRRDVAIDVDVIEELARIWGYHNITSTLPDAAPPTATPSAALAWEQEVKVRLRDWGYTELYTYSMISEELMAIFGLNKTKAYLIKNPLSEEWVYMRPSLLPGILAAISQNLSVRNELALFELSMEYGYQPENLPKETPHLVIAATGTDDAFRRVKGLAQALFQLFGIPFSAAPGSNHPWYQPHRMLKLAEYGVMGEIETTLLEDLHIKKPVVILDLDFTGLVSHAKPQKTYTPIPKYPPIIEDFSFVVPQGFTVGPLMEALARAHPLIADAAFLDAYQTTRTVRVTYLDRTKNLTDEAIKPVRQKLLAAAEKLGATLKT